MQRPSMMMPAIWGGITIGILSSVPILNLINCACCAGVMLGGVVAVFVYRRQMPPDEPMLMGDGASLGLLAGVFGAIISTGLSYLLSSMSLEWLRRVAEMADNPEFDQVLDQLGPTFFAKGIIFIGFVINLIADCLFGLIGGLIGVSIFGRSHYPPAPTWQQPPQPPTQS